MGGKKKDSSFFIEYSFVLLVFCIILMYYVVSNFCTKVVIVENIGEGMCLTIMYDLRAVEYWDYTEW